MKKLLYGIAIAFTMIAFSTESQAQTSKMETKTITAADTITFTNVPSNIVAVAYSYIETSGTTAGKIYLEATNLPGQWVAIDSVTLADVATVQGKTTAITTGTYLNYRYRNTNTSSATGSVKAMYLRRQDQN